jgi:hypothetical protein
MKKMIPLCLFGMVSAVSAASAGDDQIVSMTANQITSVFYQNLDPDHVQVIAKVVSAEIKSETGAKLGELKKGTLVNISLPKACESRADSALQHSSYELYVEGVLEEPTDTQNHSTNVRIQSGKGLACGANAKWSIAKQIPPAKL